MQTCIMTANLGDNDNCTQNSHLGSISSVLWLLWKSYYVASKASTASDVKPGMSQWNCSLIRVYTVCHSVCNFMTNYSLGWLQPFVLVSKFFSFLQQQALHQPISAPVFAISPLPLISAKMTISKYSYSIHQVLPTLNSPAQAYIQHLVTSFCLSLSPTPTPTYAVSFVPLISTI